ncbi:hypothetical protein XBFFL1_1040046 [Xenorhabdus bovienii str. feltiae Florida]|nr:hypothetical protein XBFFR1_970004 [Xenorhabdus bovienii str. feltiae France]CDG90714.1 hypothetical protein XBFFL1_1040046 [Xenorhabdus bovienii str. feltiae Florida]
MHISGAGASQIIVVEVLPVRRDGRLIGNTVSILPVCGLGSEEGTQCIAVGLRGVLPIGPDWVPAFTQPFFIGITVLRNDACNPFGMPHSKPEASRRAVVKHINSEPVKADHIGESVDDLGNVIEGVFERTACRHVGLAKPW